MGSYWGVQCQEEPLFELKQKPELAGSCRRDVLSWGGRVRAVWGGFVWVLDRCGALRATEIINTPALGWF